MESKLFKFFVSLGVPGLALGIFYMLFRTFGWEFPIVPSNWVGPIIVLFMLLTSSIVFYALTLWRPKPISPIIKGISSNSSPSGAVALQKVLELMGEFLERESNDLKSSKNTDNKDISKQIEYINAAKTAVQRAANHTRHYLADCRVGERNRKSERELSDEWLEVGDRLRKIDNRKAQDLYVICFWKARYWSDTDGWNASYAHNADNADIRLETVLRIIEEITTLN